MQVSGAQFTAGPALRRARACRFSLNRLHQLHCLTTEVHGFAVSPVVAVALHDTSRVLAVPGRTHPEATPSPCISSKRICLSFVPIWQHA